MKRLLLLLLVFIIPVDLLSATITAQNAGGDWSSTATWVGGVVPDPVTDTVVIPSTLTAPVVIDDNCTLPATTIEDEVYGLVQGAGVVTTLGGALTIGNGAGKDGAFVFGQGSTLAQGGNNVILGNCKIRSNATTNNWAIVTGSGNWQTHETVWGPKQDIVLRYVSFQNTGSISWAHKPTGTGSVENQIDIQHAVFAGIANFSSGLGNTGETNMIRIFQNIDFRDITGTFFFDGLTGIPTDRPVLKHCTFHQSTTYTSLRINSLSKWGISENVFDGVGYGISSTATSGGHEFDGNFWTFYTDCTNANAIGMSSDYAASNITNSYFFSDYSNPHTISYGASGEGTGTSQISGDVFEELFNSDGGNFIHPGALAVNAVNNLVIGNGVLGYTTIPVSGEGATFKNNTVYVTSLESEAYGHMWLFESTGNYTGGIKLSSNLMAYKSTLNPSSASRFASNNTDTVPLTIDYGNYNSYPSVGTDHYRQLIVTTTGNDLLDIDPQFVDPTRNLAKWGQIVHGTDGTVASAKEILLAINGYNATTKTQGTPSGATIYGTDTALVNWVRAGFAPTNTALQTAGEGGTYIGAVDVVSLGSSSVSALLMVQ